MATVDVRCDADASGNGKCNMQQHTLQFIEDEDDGYR